MRLLGPLYLVLVVDGELSRGPLGRNAISFFYLSPEAEDPLFWQPQMKVERKERQGGMTFSITLILNPAVARSLSLSLPVPLFFLSSQQ